MFGFKLFFACGLFVLLMFAQNGMASPGAVLSKGQTIYVPVYSNIFTAPKEFASGLVNLLNFRNTEMFQLTRITTADYYDTEGRVLKCYYPKPVKPASLQSTHLYLLERDKQGGVEANFIVKWESDKKVNVPIIECVNAGNQGSAFVTQGRVIVESAK